MAKEKEDRVDPFESGENDAALFLEDAIKQIEDLTDDINGIQEEIRDIYRELGGKGYDTKVVRRLIAVKKAQRRNLDKWEAEETIFHVYARSLNISVGDSY